MRTNDEIDAEIQANGKILRDARERIAELRCERAPETTHADQRLRIVQAVREFGPYRGPAAKHLIALLAEPNGVPRRETLETLAILKVTGARAEVREVLASGTLEDASFAAAFLVAVEDRVVDSEIVARLAAATPTEADAPWLWRLVGILDRINHRAAVRFARQWQSDAAFPASYRDTLREIVEREGD